MFKKLLLNLRFQAIKLLSGKSCVMLNGKVIGKIFVTGGDYPIISNVQVDPTNPYPC